jgi:hypothetical protein
VDDVEQVGHGGERLRDERDGCSSSTCSAPPSSNQMMTLSRLGVPARALSVASAARRMSSRAIGRAAHQLALVLELQLAR